MVSSLSLSPSAVSQLAFYARRLKQEKVTRLFSVIAAVLVVGLQFAAILAPPTPSNAASSSDLIYGGIVSKADLLEKYDKSAELRGIYNYFGITRADIAASHKTTVSSTDHSLNSMGRVPHSDTDKVYKINGVKYYYRPLFHADHGIASGSTYTVMAGHRASDGAFFAVMFLCGNIIPPKPPAPAPTPKPTPPPTPQPGLACSNLTGDTSSGEVPLKVNYTAAGTSTGQTITNYVFNFGDGTTQTTTSNKTSHTYTKAGIFKATVQVTGSRGATTPISSGCALTITANDKPGQIIQSKTAWNVTQNIPAESKAANAGDIIKYTLITKNIGGTAVDYIIEDDLTDVLEYADIIDTGGAKIVDRIIIWPSVKIAAGATVNKTFTAQVKNPVPTTPAGISDKYSFDLMMDNVYGNSIHVPITPPIPKQIEVAASSMPQTGAGTTTILVLIIVAMTIFFYLRNRQLVSEVKILRHDYQGGA